MCLNLQGIGTKLWCPIMIRVYGSLPAKKCIELLDQNLPEYGLQLNTDIVCICTDGASVMTNVGRLIATDQQLCFAQGIQLAVLAVLYKRRTLTIVQQDNVDVESNSLDDIDDDDDGTSTNKRSEQSLKTKT